MRIVIVGAGPVGLLLAYQLVSNGVAVRVLEQHPDFGREFRGELVHASVLPALDQLGILPILVERGVARLGVERRMFVGKSRRVEVPGGGERNALVQQARMLEVLDELCRAHGDLYQLDTRTTALRAVKDGERVVGLEVRREGKAERVDGDLFVVCNGRHSALRKDVVPLELEEKPEDTLWLRFDCADAVDQLPDTLDVHMHGGGVVIALFRTSSDRLQLAFSSPGDLGALRKDVPALRARLLPLLPEPIRDLVARKLDADFESQLLKVAIDRLARWHAPGILFLGDAAHTASPAGGTGLNLAMRDGIVAANHLIDAVRAGAVDEAVLAAIEAERRPEIEQVQAGQMRAHDMASKPLFALHALFTMLGVVMRFKRFEAPPTPEVLPKHGG